MPRLIQVIALVLLLVISPIAGTNCGAHCLAVAVHFSQPQPAAMQHEWTPASCCPSAPTFCGAAAASDSSAFLLATASTAPDTLAGNVYATASASLSLSSGLTFMNSSPPDQAGRAGPIPLRI